MGADSSRVTSKGQIVIPKKLREKYKIAPAMTIRWISREEGLLMVPETGDVIKAARGMNTTYESCGVGVKSGNLLGSNPGTIQGDRSRNFLSNTPNTATGRLG